MVLLPREDTALVVIDVQEKLFPHIENGWMSLRKIELAVKGFKALDLPILSTEQYPEGLGPTVSSLKRLLQNRPYPKTSFSCYGSTCFVEDLEKLGKSHVVLCGIEAHVCVWQTANDLIAQGKHVVILNDAIGSRSIYDYSTAIGELRDLGARISTVEAVLFELLRDASDPKFKTISELVKCGGGESSQSCCTPSCCS